MEQLNVLVTGSSGFIGSRLVKALQECHISVLGVDIREAPTTDVQLDLSNSECCLTLSKLMETKQITHVIHLAALIRVGEGEKQPIRYWNVNFKGTYNVLHSMEKAKVKKLIFTSSAAVYDTKGSQKIRPLNEDAPVDPISVYGRTKLHAEKLIRGWKGIDSIILRLSNVAGGKEEDPCHLIPLMLESCMQGKSPKIFGDDYWTFDGTCWRTFVHVKDVINYIILLIRLIDHRSRIYNVGRTIAIVSMVYSCIREFLEGENINCPEVKVVARRQGDPPAISLDDTRLRNDLQIDDRLGFREMIEDTFYEMLKK